MSDCRRCGQENPASARFCLACGTPLVGAGEGRPAREERKVVTVVFCDLVGFTARSDNADPEDVRARLLAYHVRVRREVERYGGTVDKFIGDGIMAVFGAPISRPDDPVRSVRSAIGMRRSLREFNARQRARGGIEIDIGIGISHGESISGNIGSEQRMEYTVIGDSVNLASRLEGRTVCVLLGEEYVKGKTQAVRVYGVPDPPE